MNEEHIAEKIAQCLYKLDRKRNTAFVLALILVAIVGFGYVFHYSQDIRSLGNNKIINISQIGSYDNILYHKELLSTSDYEGMLVELNHSSNSRFWNCVLNGEYEVAFLRNDKILGSTTIAGTNEMQVIECPVTADDMGYNKMLFMPRAGQEFSICYLSEIETLKESTKKVNPIVKKAYHLKGENYSNGSEYDVTGIIAYSDSMSEKTTEIIIESVSGELVSIPLSLENGAGDTMAVFPEGARIMPRGAGPSYASFLLDTEGKKCEISDLYVTYKYKNSKILKKVKVEPFKPVDMAIYNSTLVRTRDNLKDFSQLIVKDNQVSFSKNKIVLDKPLFIPEGKELVITEGQTIDLVKGAFILSRSPVHMLGTKEKPILIHSTDNSINAGLAVIQADKRSVLDYVIFDNLGEVSSGIWQLTGAVTFYEADVDFNNCDFLNNRSEDGLNTVRSDISLTGCTIRNTYQDAFDSDFCTGTFDKCYFEKTGNDGFDVSGSTFEIKDTNFKEIHDKAVSVGERSSVTIDTISAVNVQIGIGAKDSSVVNAKRVYVKNMLIGFCSYQKKPEFGPSKITIDGYSLEGTMDFKYLIEKNDLLIVDGIQWKPSNNKKQAIIIKRLINEEPLK